MHPMTIRIPAGGSQSDPFEILEDYQVGGIWIPANWTPAPITFRYSPDGKDPFCAVHDKNDNEIVIDASTHGGYSPTVYLLGDTALVGGMYIRLVSGDENADIPQGEDVACYMLWGT